jgi:hypothetical protein
MPADDRWDLTWCLKGQYGDLNMFLFEFYDLLLIIPYNFSDLPSDIVVRCLLWQLSPIPLFSLSLQYYQQRIQNENYLNYFSPTAAFHSRPVNCTKAFPLTVPANYVFLNCDM